MAKITPFQRLQFIRNVAPQSICRAKGVNLSIIESDDATFEDVLTCSDGTLLVLFRWKDNGECDHIELTELLDEECEAIIEAIKSKN